MSQLASLKAVKNLRQVAHLLKCKPKALSYTLYKLPASLKYTQFAIQKRSGGTRIINAPIDRLKLLQRRLADLLSVCLEEIEAGGGREHSACHGFKKRRSILTNAKAHRGRRYVFNVDLEDFFPSIHLGRIRGLFIKDRNFQLQPDVATVLAQIACHNGVLPQGSPCSPVISNLIGHVLDTHLVRLGAQYGCRYTRYADDLTFSTNEPAFPESIAKQVIGKEHEWVAGTQLAKIVARSGFKINAPKTRMQYHDSRQEVTGLVVNRKVNVKTEYRRLVRLMTHRLLRTGEFSFTSMVAGTKTDTPGNERELHGMLGFVDQLDLMNYEREMTALGLRSGEKWSGDDKQRASILKEKLSSKERAYRQFLLFTQMYAATRPVIICEGSTDSVYLVHAIRSLVASVPMLASKSAKSEVTINVRLYRYFRRRKKKDGDRPTRDISSTGRILELHGGSNPLLEFGKLYRANHPKFTAPGGYEPVILLIDNDDGAGALLHYWKVTKPLAAYSHLFGNLYLLPIPLLPGLTKARIEDLFDVKVRSTLVDGKSFDPDKTHEDHAHYGKVVFAHKVVKPNADTIDFSNFKELLLTVSKVIGDHRKNHPKPVI